MIFPIEGSLREVAVPVAVSTSAHIFGHDKN
jgi:hypothetical protein